MTGSRIIHPFFVIAILIEDFQGFILINGFYEDINVVMIA